MLSKGGAWGAACPHRLEDLSAMKAASCLSSLQRGGSSGGEQCGGMRVKLCCLAWEPGKRPRPLAGIVQCHARRACVASWLEWREAAPAYPSINLGCCCAAMSSSPL